MDRENLPRAARQMGVGELNSEILTITPRNLDLMIVIRQAPRERTDSGWRPKAFRNPIDDEPASSYFLGFVDTGCSACACWTLAAVNAF